MRIWTGSEHCHRHFTDFMLFFAPTKKVYVSWQLVRMSTEVNESETVTWVWNFFPSLLYWNGTWCCPGWVGCQKRKIKRNGWTKSNLKKIRPLFTSSKTILFQSFWYGEDNRKLLQPAANKKLPKKGSLSVYLHSAKNPRFSPIPKYHFVIR